MEWKLDADVFQATMKQLGPCEVDLFASCVKAKLDRYVSWQADPGAFAANAVSLNWSEFTAHCVPPFCLNPRVLQHVEGMEADCVMVIPLWTTRVVSETVRLLTDNPMLLPKSENLLTHPLSGHE